MVGAFVQLNIGSLKAKSHPVGYVLDGNGCWEWVGSICPRGYGSWRAHGEQRAHRAVYRMLRGPIPEGLTLDHLCRNRSCVNPDHLEAVTNKVNILRGEGVCAKHARQTHCNRGHPLDEMNTIVDKRGRRRCHICNNNSSREWGRRIRALAMLPA